RGQEHAQDPFPHRTSPSGPAGPDPYGRQVSGPATAFKATARSSRADVRHGCRPSSPKGGFRPTAGAPRRRRLSRICGARGRDEVIRMGFTVLFLLLVV